MAADEITQPHRRDGDERTRILAALVWALRNVPEVPPRDAESGWTATARIDYEQNREAAIAILREARGAAGLDGVRLEEPADLVPGIFVLVETAPPADVEPVACGPSTPLHNRRFDGTRVVGCMPGCPACAAGLPDPIAAAAPAGTTERKAQLERAGVAVVVDGRVLPRDAAAARADVPLFCGVCFQRGHGADACPWRGGAAS